MRKLPLVKYISKQVADALDADGIFNIPTRTIRIRRGQDWNDEMETVIHELIHWCESSYAGKLKPMKDDPDLNNNEVDKMANKICRMMVKAKYKYLFK